MGDGLVTTATARLAYKRREHHLRPSASRPQQVTSAAVAANMASQQVLQQIADELLEHTKRLGLFDEMRVRLIEQIESSSHFDKVTREFKRQVAQFCQNCDLSLTRSKLRERLEISRSMSPSTELIREHVIAIARKHKQEMRTLYEEKARAYLANRVSLVESSGGGGERAGVKDTTTTTSTNWRPQRVNKLSDVVPRQLEPADKLPPTNNSNGSSSGRSSSTSSSDSGISLACSRSSGAKLKPLDQVVSSSTGQSEHNKLVVSTSSSNRCRQVSSSVSRKRRVKETKLKRLVSTTPTRQRAKLRQLQ